MSLVESCQRIDVYQLIESYQAALKKELINSQFEVEGLLVVFTESKTGNGGTRLWFKCPSCSRRVGILYKNPSSSVGCRICLNLDYRSHRFKGLIEARFSMPSK